jgi:CRP/FNR family transcriptional regulator, cyclic AMP receptor protein
MLTDSEKKAVIPMLQEVPLFSSLEKKGLSSIANSAAKKSYNVGDKIAKEGEKAITFYLILNGAVEVRRKDKVLAKLGRGQFFGEMALFDNQPRSADVVAAEPTTCILLTSWALAGVIGANPKIATQIIAELVRRLRESDRALTE